MELKAALQEQTRIQWTPANKSFPEEGKEVLVLFNDGSIVRAHRAESCWVISFLDLDSRKAIGWQEV